MRKITLLFAIIISILAVQLSFAAPSLTITKPPVTPDPSWTGPGVPLPPLYPMGDPHAKAGQWFTDRTTHTVFTNLTHEFYDNIDPDFGGGSASFLAINGYVTAIVYDNGPGSAIVGFDILATIHNDIPALSPWASGTNSHGEQRAFVNMEDQKFEGPLLDVKLTAEFSIDSIVPFPVPFFPPYMDPYPGVYIEALNHDCLAWYCWNTNDFESPYSISGDFHVPTWDFGNIAQGASKNRTMQFAIASPGLDPADPRYSVILSSFQNNDDILVNRTTSLKISNWIEDLVTDPGTPYPGELGHNSDVSVFHTIPEPGTFTGILMIILGLYRRFKK